tara:strand:- start:525 stop:908 length:384 start_codon:yes stop_codon:yes gene_type:complete
MSRRNRITIVILGILAFLLFRYWNKKRKEVLGNYVDPTCIKEDFSNVDVWTANMCQGFVNDEFLVLKKGDMGCEVRSLQIRINQVIRTGTPQGMDAETILEDGRFGCNTQGALQKVRNRKSITLNEF